MASSTNNEVWQWVPESHPHHGKFYQHHSRAMGSSVSPIITNVYMEEFEKSCLQSAPHTQSRWFRLTCVRHIHGTTFRPHPEIQHHTSTHQAHTSNSQWSTEEHLCLNTLIHVLDDGSTKVTTYMKKDPHWSIPELWSTLPSRPQVKKSVFRTLFYRAEQIVTSPEGRESEKHHIRKVQAFTVLPTTIFPLKDLNLRNLGRKGRVWDEPLSLQCWRPVQTANLAL